MIASDETTTRLDGITHWHWVFVSDRAVLHEIAPRRAKAVAEQVLGPHRPEVWISDRYAGQQDLAGAHQVCLAHVLRDVQYAIDCGDSVVAPKIRGFLRWTIRIGRRRGDLRDTTLAQYHAKADRRLEVGRDDDRCLLIEPADQMEQQLAAGLGKRQVAELVEHDEVEAAEQVGGAALSP